MVLRDDGKGPVTIAPAIDHQQIAYEMNDHWELSESARRRAMKRFLALPPLDAVLVAIRFVDLADGLIAGLFVDKVARRADRERKAAKP